ncbi:hypothetical protein ACHAXS_012681 [Conticribra weissflogii]
MNTPDRSSHLQGTPALRENFPFDRLFIARPAPIQLIPTSLATPNAPELRSDHVGVTSENSFWTAYRETSATLESDTDNSSVSVDGSDFGSVEEIVDSDDFHNEDENGNDMHAFCNFGAVNDRFKCKEKDAEFECLICSEKLMGLTNVASISGCIHLFCFDCIYQWSKAGHATSHQCPTCRATFKKISTLDGSKVATVGSTDDRKMLRRLERHLWARFHDFQNTAHLIGRNIARISELQDNLGLENDLHEIEGLIEELDSRMEEYFNNRLDE